MEQRPIFLLSLPRSGSTLLQRLLASHEQIATTSEPWVLLPLLYTLRRPGAYTEYGHRAAVRAIEDFCEQLPGRREQYLAGLRELVLELYAGVSHGEQYFLDKSPRYHLVVDEILEMFPDGRFVFLWRQPLAVAASIIDSFGPGHWNLEKYHVDLYDGLDNLVAAYRPEDPRCISVRFEDLLLDTEGQVARLLGFLGLDPQPGMAQAFDAVELKGRMGDRTGTATYSTISDEPLEKWHDTMGTFVRRQWCRGFLKRVGPVRVAAMGYSYQELEAQVEALSGRPGGAASDVARRMYGSAYRRGVCRLLNPGSRELAKQAEARKRILAASP